MSEDFGNDIITVSDEDGNDLALEHLDTIEQDGKVYMAFLPADIDEDSEDYGIVILAVDGEDLVSIEDIDLLESLYDTFMERLFEDEDFDEDED